jgi:Ca2+-binding RTX toxin-like protein
LKNRIRVSMSALAALTVAVVAAALAWACVPTARITLNPTSGAAGSVVTVNGTGFNPGPVTLRWNEDGPILKNVDAAGTDPNQGAQFTTTVTIPAAPPGCYTITATSNSFPAGAPFEIPGSNCSASPNPTPRTPAPPPPPAGGGNTTGGFFPTSNANCQGKAVTTVGTSGRDVIEGTRGADVIAALGGNDAIKGLGGNDVICGGAGRDTLTGGRGNDHLSGGAGRDRLLGGAGRDRIDGGAAKDTCVGGSGRDRMKSC